MKRIIVLSFFLFFNLQAVDPLEEILIFSGNANRPLAEKVAANLGIPLGNAKVARFNDGEINIQILDNIRKRDVYIIQSTCPGEKQSINDNLMELFLLVRAMKRSSARSITAVIPYYGYARQDRKTSSRVPISAADVALMLENAGVDRVLTIDLHCGQIQGFFNQTPVDNLYAAPLFASYFVEKKLNNLVVVSPDAGGVQRATKFRDHLVSRGVPAQMAMISKQREGAGVVGAMDLIGSVANADVILIDDICDTGGTLIKAAELLKKNGAKRVFVVATHPVFSMNALEKIGSSMIDEMIVADTIPLSGTVPPNVSYLSISPLLGEAIKRIQKGESISALFM